MQMYEVSMYYWVYVQAFEGNPFKGLTYKSELLHS